MSKNKKLLISVGLCVIILMFLIGIVFQNNLQQTIKLGKSFITFNELMEMECKHDEGDYLWEDVQDMCKGTCGICGHVVWLEHNFGEYIITKEATCTEAGVKTKTCSVCGAKEIEYIPALEHVWKNTNNVDSHVCERCGQHEAHKYNIEEATCIEKYCEICGYVDEPASLEHRWEEANKEQHVCERCGNFENHEFVEEVTREAKCLEPGEKQKVCKCGRVEKEEILPLGHDYEKTIIPPTCTEKGYTIYTCTRCGHTFKDTDTDELGHKWDATTGKCTVCEEECAHNKYIVNVTKEATCTEAGEKTKTCSVCGKTETEEIPALGHTEVIDAAKEATCTETGLTEGKHCVTCGMVTKEQEEISALGHNYEETVTAPTCTEKGYTTHTCTRCGNNYEDTYTDALGHNYEETITAPTCTEKGYTTYTCTRCEHNYKDTNVDALGHKYEEEITKEATCTEAGEKVKTCSACGKTETEEIPALGHKYGTEYTIDKEATCTETGILSLHCIREGCKDNIFKLTIPAKGHKWDATTGKCTVCEEECAHNKYIVNVTKEATCTEAGEKTKTCSVCGKTETEEIPALGHKYTEKITKEATCTEAGEKTKTCSGCGKTETEVIPALGHTEVIDAAKEATCIETGLTEGKHCVTCGMVTKEQEEISALGHNYEETVTAPTCTEKGYTTHTCTRCGNNYEDTYTDALGHNYEETITAPTCTEKGYTTYTCTRCEHNYKDTNVDALGHNYKDGVCTNCGEKEPVIKATSDEYTILDLYITQIQPKTTVTTLKSNITTNASKITIYGEGGTVKDTSIVKTGMKIVFELNDDKVILTLVVRGDVDGDGEAGFEDMITINKHRLHRKNLTGAYELAGDVTADGEANFMDMIQINRYRLNRINNL